MKTYDWSKAEAVVDAYLRALSSDQLFLGKLGRVWMESTMAKVGLVSDWRGWQFMESHAAWYACLILSRKISAVTAAETARGVRGTKTAATIRKLQDGRLRGSAAAILLEQMLETARKPASR